MKIGQIQRQKWLGLIFVCGSIFLALPLHLKAAERMYTAYFSPAPGGSSVIWVAKEARLFEKHGLDVAPVLIPSSVRTLQAILAGESAIAESAGVTICVELLNSKVNHPDYQGDRTAFGVAVVKAVNSPRVKLLYDIYHMQIMEGDLIKTIRDQHEHIGHYHTGGVPGRHELDGTQEVNWPAVCRAIVDTGFHGYLAHEFVPTRDPLTSLREAVALCDV